MEYDLHNNITGLAVLASAVIASDTTTASTVVDTAGFESADWHLAVETYTDGSYAFLVEESDVANFAGQQTVVDPDLVLTSVEAITATGLYRVGSVGKARYQRVSIVSTGTTTGARIGMTVVLGHPKVRPTA